MTKAILKEIDDRIESARKFLPEEYLSSLKSLRVAVKDLDYIKRSDADNCTFAYKSLLEIAIILGVKEEDK